MDCVACYQAANWRRVGQTNLLITNTGGTIGVKLTCPSDPGESTIVRASAPLSQGRSVCNDYRIIGTAPTPAAGSSDITSMYTTRYGVPTAGSKVFVRISQYVSGFESGYVSYSAIVPDAV